MELFHLLVGVCVGLWIFLGRAGLNVYFTSVGPFLMHYSKHVIKIATLKAGGTVFVFIISPDFVFTCVASITRLLLLQ